MTVALLAGALDLGFAAFHLMFWRLFQWPARLEASGKVNEAITQTLNLVLIYVFVAYGVALIWTAASLPPMLAWAGAGFWLLRMALQPRLFPMRNGPSVAITVVFAATAAVHALAALQG